MKDWICKICTVYTPQTAIIKCFLKVLLELMYNLIIVTSGEQPVHAHIDMFIHVLINISFVYDKQRGQIYNEVTHLTCSFDLIPCFMFFHQGNSTYHSITGRLVDLVISLVACSGRWEQGRFMFFTFVWENQRQPRNSARLKSFSDRTREERKQVYLVPGLLTTTCMCPPVVSKIALTQKQHPRGIKTNPKISFEKTKTLENIHSKTLSLAQAQNSDILIYFCMFSLSLYCSCFNPKYCQIPLS